MTHPALTPSQWIQQCAQKLQERWQTVDPEQLEEVAVDIWTDDTLRHLTPAEAAEAWLSPLSSPAHDSHT